MWFARAARAWSVSAFSCVVLLAGWVVSMQVVSGRMEHLWKNMLGLSMAFGSVFALTAALLYVPAFGVLSGVLGKRLTPPVAVVIGTALSPVAYLAVAWQFREAEDPQTVYGWLLYWKSHMSEVIIGVLPFLVAGALFGWLWTRHGNERRLSREMGRAV